MSRAVTAGSVRVRPAGPGLLVAHLHQTAPGPQFGSEEGQFKFGCARRPDDAGSDPDEVLRAEDLHEFRPGEPWPGEVEGAAKIVLDDPPAKLGKVAHIDDLHMVGTIAGRQHFPA